MAAEFVIACPGCRQPLKVPASAVGKPAHCPHCRATFDLPAGADGRPAEPRRRRTIPRVLVYPAFLLLMLGLAGTLVNAYLTALFVFVPGADLEFARGRVREVRMAQIQTELGKKTPENWEHAPRAAVGGVAAAAATTEVANAAADDRLATSWAPGMTPIHVASTFLSALVFVGAACMLRGRCYPLALLGCAAAILNVNHLCCVPGAFAGVWGILALARDESRQYFRSERVQG